MPKTLKKLKPRREALSTYLLVEDAAAVRKAAELERRKITSYIESVVVPKAKKDIAKEGR